MEDLKKDNFKAFEAMADSDNNVIYYTAVEKFDSEAKSG